MAFGRAIRQCVPPCPRLPVAGWLQRIMRACLMEGSAQGAAGKLSELNTLVCTLEEGMQAAASVPQGQPAMPEEYCPDEALMEVFFKTLAE